MAKECWPETDVLLLSHMLSCRMDRASCRALSKSNVLGPHIHVSALSKLAATSSTVHTSVASMCAIC